MSIFFICKKYLFLMLRIRKKKHCLHKEIVFKKTLSNRENFGYVITISLDNQLSLK